MLNRLYGLICFCFVFSAPLSAIVYLERPDDFKPRFELSALFIERPDGKVLFLHRQDNKSQGNSWGIPGGKVDKGETPMEALVREIKEETGIVFSPEVITPIQTVYITNTVRNKVSYVYRMYRTPYSGSFVIQMNPEEHKGYTWVTLKDALKMELMDDEDPCIRLAYPEVACQKG